ncbi:MAG: hypothetical protein QG570_373 [Patescibacteria group bacterium]|nr:hypothetical protein [Patescibacteria group bacterium]
MIQIKSVVLIFVSTFFACLSAYYSSTIIYNFLSEGLAFAWVFLFYLCFISLFLFFHYLILATHENKKIYISYYLILITSVIATIAIQENRLSPIVLILNALVILLTLILVQIKFRTEYKNLIKVNLTIASSSVTFLILAIALLTSLNFYHVGMQGDTKDEIYSDFKEYIFKQIETTTQTYMKTTTEAGIGVFSQSALISDQLEQTAGVTLDRYSPYFLIFSSAIIFITILTIGPFLRFLIWILDLTLLKFLEKIGFVKNIKITVEAERFSL